mgnify:CR=1 FL=1
MTNVRYIDETTGLSVLHRDQTTVPDRSAWVSLWGTFHTVVRVVWYPDGHPDFADDDIRVYLTPKDPT